jgi:lipopolysaccharide export system permease protein
MKKLLFQKFLKDNLKFFTISCFTIGLIVWVIKAVGFLDIVAEDGHGFSVYFFYSALSFPKILNKILPFVFFISLFYQLIRYELNNELLLFWINGVHKRQFINVIIFYSVLVSLFQIILSGYVTPFAQNEARSYIRESGIDFFPSLIKEGKFLDTVKNLTIFIESKDTEGNYKNIYLKDDIGAFDIIKKSQIIYAKKGSLINKDPARYLELFDGKIINVENDKITSFTFKKIEFNLSKFSSKTTTYPKIQETPSAFLFECLDYDLKGSNYEFEDTLDESKNNLCKDKSVIKQELFKRFYKPIYLPLVGLICCLLIIKSKENNGYNNLKFFLFLLVLIVLIISEVSVRYSTYNIFGFYFFILFPILTFLIFYIPIITKFRNKI